MRLFCLAVLTVGLLWLACEIETSGVRAQAHGRGTREWRRTVNGWEASELWHRPPVGQPIHPATVATVQVFVAYALTSRRLRSQFSA